MATWFAQNSSVNIDSVNQWNSAADGSGSWLTWASLAAGDVLVANGKTAIDLNVSFTCSEIRTLLLVSGASGGGFVLSTSGITVTANVLAGTTVCVTATLSSGTSNIVGTVNGSATTNAAHGITFSGAGTLNVTGNVFAGQTGGTNSGSGVLMSGAGTLNVTGNSQSSQINGSSGSAQGIQVTGAAIVNLTGNCLPTGTGGGNACGITCANALATVTVTGTCNGPAAGNGISSSAGVYLTAGTFVLNGTAAANAGGAAVSISAGSFHHNGNITTTASGRSALSLSATAIHTVSSSSLLQHDYKSRTSGSGAIGATRSLYTGGVNLGQPVVANVRSGTTYGVSSEYTGTLAVPSPTLVAIGVSTDNTVGSYLGITSQDLDTALAGIPKVGQTHRYTQVASTSTTTDVSIGAAT